jgi:DNA-binding PadR family transcriptional regulator
MSAMLDQPGRSLLQLAEHLGWTTTGGEPSKGKVHRLMKELQKAKLVELQRDGHYTLSKKGEEEAAKTPEDPVKIVPKKEV